MNQERPQQNIPAGSSAPDTQNKSLEQGFEQKAEEKAVQQSSSQAAAQTPKQSDDSVDKELQQKKVTPAQPKNVQGKAFTPQTAKPTTAASSSEKEKNQPQQATMSSNDNSLTQKGKDHSSFLMVNIMAVLSFVLAIIAIVLVVVIWMSMDKVDRRVEERLSGVTGTLAEAQSSAKSAKEIAQQSFDKYNEAAGKLSFTSSQIDSLNEQTRRIDAFSDQIKSMRTLDGDMYGALEIAQIQAQLVGSAEPVLFTLKAIDERLQRQGQSAQSELRRAIAQDIESISSTKVPDALMMSKAVSHLLGDADEWRLVIDAPRVQDFSADKTPAAPTTMVESGIAEEAATTRPKGNFFSRSWDWTSDKAGALGQSTWKELTSIIRITPIKNPEAVLMSPEQGAILRENMKLRFLNLRLSVLQKQFDSVQAEIAQISAILSKYYETSDENVAQALQKLAQLKDQAHAIEIPEPIKTKMALAALNNNRQ